MDTKTIRKRVKLVTFDEARAFFGSGNKMAKAIGCTAQNISHWKRRGIPIVRQYQIDDLMHKRRPDSVA